MIKIIIDFGFGKGYYDRFLKNVSFVKIGICFEEQFLKDEELPTDENDVKMDKIFFKWKLRRKDG